MFDISDDDKWVCRATCYLETTDWHVRIKFVSSVGTLGKDLDDFQVSFFGLFAHYHSDWHSESHCLLA